MDDTDDKARRNLVIAAGVICMSALAGLPLEVIVDRVLGIGHDAYKGLRVSPMRLWACVTLVLAYLATRYRFADETTTQLANAKLEWGSLLAQGCEREVLAALRRLSRTGADSPIFRDRMAEVQATAPEGLARGRVSNISFEHKGRYVGRAQWTSGDGLGHTAGHRRAFHITGWRRARVRVNAAGFLLIHSRTALQVVIPSVLAGVACLVAVWNIGRALFA